MVLCAIGGTASIISVIDAVKAGKQIALASKEAIVSAGGIVMRLAKNTAWISFR
jgi:1-deoxy-D-xylulose-5-phosphate reductoisomerase